MPGRTRWRIAKRAAYKASRALESLACLHLAITSLVLLAVFLAKVYTITTRWWIASAFLFSTSLLPFADALNLRNAKYPECEGRRGNTSVAIDATVVYLSE